MKLVSALVVATCFAVAAPVASGKSSVLASGHPGPLVWRLTASSKRSSHPAGPGYCIDFDVTSAGRFVGSGGECLHRGDVAISMTGIGVEWVGVGAGTPTHAVDAFIAAVDAHAVRVVITLKSGRVLRARTHALPDGLDPGARVVWVVRNVSPQALNSPGNDVRRVLAYDQAGQLVATG